MKNAHSPNKQNERPDNAILIETKNAAIDFRVKCDAPTYPNRAERRAITKSFNKESIADLDLIREGSSEAMRLMSTLPAALKDLPFELAIEACKWMGNIQLRHGYDHATKKQTAIHEAGHIVAVQALGIQATNSRIWRVFGRWNGFTTWDANYAQTTAHGIFLRSVTLLAGWRAEILGGLSHPSSSLDERFLVEQRSCALDYAQGMPLRTTMSATERFTDGILIRHEATLKTLAKTLSEKGTLWEAEIEELLVDELKDKELQQLVRSKMLEDVNNV
jgi:hypothetical protein